MEKPYRKIADVDDINETRGLKSCGNVIGEGR